MFKKSVGNAMILPILWLLKMGKKCEIGGSEEKDYFKPLPRGACYSFT